MKRKSINHRISICVALTLVILTYGCATTPKRMYTGEVLPKDRVAIIEGSTNLLFIYFFSGVWSRKTTVLISEVDDKALFDLPKKCEVLPGLHNVVVEVERFWDEGSMYSSKSWYILRTVPLKFNAIAGHKYRIKVEKGKYLLALDIRSSEVVAKKPIYLSRNPFGDISTLQQRDDLRMSLKAYWLGGDCGFYEGWIPGNMRIRAVAAGTRGFLRATDNQLSFLVWDGDKYMYMPLFELGYDKITKVVVEKYGLAKKLVVLAKNKDCYSFKLKKRNAIEIADFISKKIEQQ